MLERMESYQAMVQEMYRVIGSRELLEKTLENLAQGWDQGQLVNNDGDLCLLGGLSAACTRNTDRRLASRYVPGAGTPQHAEWRAALKLLRQALLDMPEAHSVLGDDHLQNLRTDPDHILYAIPAFNDHKSTTYEDVTLLVKRAIEKSGEESTEDE